MNEKTLMKLEVLLDLVKTTEKALILVAKENLNDSDAYARGVGTGLETAVTHNKKHLEKLESIIRKAQGYLEEDVDLGGGEDIEESVI